MNAAKLHTSVLRCLGQAVTASPAGGDPVSLRAIFRKKPSLISPSEGVRVRGGRPVIKCRMDDLPQGLAKGDGITVGSENYVLAHSPKGDENGWCVLELHSA